MPTALPGTEQHPHARAVLGAALPPAGRPSHAYLFHGPSGTGNRAVAQAFATALLALAATTDARVIAEGIETQGEVDCLRELGVPLGQGYHFARPQPW